MSARITKSASSLWAALAISVYSGVEYFVRFGRLVFNGGSR